MLYGKFMKRFFLSLMERFFSFPLCLCAFVPLCLFAFVPFSYAQQASVNSTRTNLETPIRLSVTLSEGDGDVDLSAIEDFKVLSQSSNSSVQIINGRVTSERTKTYMLLPLREGRLTIPALKVTVDGKTSYTDPITIRVEKGETSADASSENVRVTATVNEKTPYLGQQIVYTFRLLYAVQLANTDYEAPSFTGFSAKQIGESQTTQRIVDGQRFNEVSISYLLMPLKTGPLTIEPARLQCDVASSRRSSRSQFDSFFNDPFFGSTRLVTKVFQTDPVPIEVMPLPTWVGNQPFSGLVGQFDMKAELETREATVGQSLTLSVTLQGKGNLQDAESPGIRVPEGFKQYADQPETDVRLEADGYAGTKVFRTALVPVDAGEYTLTITPLVYFDPTKKSYRILEPPPLSIMVRASDNPAETPTVFSALDNGDHLSDQQKKKVDFTGRDILSIKTDLDALSSRDAMDNSWFILLLLAPGVLFLGAFLIMRAVQKDERPAAEMARKSRASLKDATGISGDDTAGLLSNLYRALLYAVLARAGMTGESLTSGEVDALLAQSHVAPKTAAAVSALFARIETARFGKTLLSRQEQTSLTAETRRLVNGLIR